VAAARASWPVAATTGVIAWLFYAGFIIGRHAVLAWDGTAAWWRLAICVGAAIAGCATGRLVRAILAPAGPRWRRGWAEAPAAERLGIRTAPLGAGTAPLGAGAPGGGAPGGGVVISLAEARRRHPASAS
jgi:hypothetical protein